MTDEKVCPDCGTPTVNYCLKCKIVINYAWCPKCSGSGVNFCKECRSAHIPVNQKVIIEEVKEDDN